MYDIEKKKQKTLDNMKSVFVNELLDSKEIYKDINNIIRDKIIKNKGENNMEKILKVEGMSCMHCVAHVKEALEKLEGVREADVKLEEKRAEVKLDKEVSDDSLVKAVEGAGYSAKIEK